MFLSPNFRMTFAIDQTKQAGSNLSRECHEFDWLLLMTEGKACELINCMRCVPRMVIYTAWYIPGRSPVAFPPNSGSRAAADSSPGIFRASSVCAVRNVSAIIERPIRLRATCFLSLWQSPYSVRDASLGVFVVWVCRALLSFNINMYSDVHKWWAKQNLVISFVN